MYTTISFPFFGLEWNPGNYLELFGFKIYYYGMIIALGLVLAFIYGMRRCRQFGIKQDDIVDGVLWIVPVAVLCARLYYCIFAWEEGGYGKDLLSIFSFRDGGLAIYGGVIGAVVSVIFYCRKRKINLFAALDLVVLGFLIGQSVGRWGNFFNREAFGSVTDSFLKMGLYNTVTGQVEYHHPTFLYESLWNIIGFIALHFLSKKRQYDGQIALGYGAWYGLGRMLIEGLRTDSLYWGPFRVSQVLAGISFVVCTAILIWQAFRPHDRAKLFVNRMPAEEPKKDKEKKK